MEDEDTVGSRTFSIHFGGGDGPVLVADLDDLVDLLLVADITLGHAADMDAQLLVLMNLEVSLPWIEKIFDFLVIDLNKADFYREFNVFRLFSDLLEETSDHSRDDTALCLILNILT